MSSVAPTVEMTAVPRLTPDPEPFYSELRKELDFDPLDRDDDSYQDFNLASLYYTEAILKLRELQAE